MDSGTGKLVKKSWHYLQIASPDHRRALPQMVLSSHSLAVERRRWTERRKKIVPQQWRLCRLCYAYIEDLDGFTNDNSASRFLFATRAHWVRITFLNFLPSSFATIGALSFVVAQVYEVEFRRRFKIIPHCTSASGTARFEHLPECSLLALLPKDETVKTFYNDVEIRARTQLIFEELVAEKEVFSKAVASLRTVRRKGKANIHITELLEDECVNDSVY
ncbi:hypothetical protein B0H13DRAFT_2395037 [Mycena leptocephala]|nr:hypothetical protein B0H13DRAFT_2395037 [Mycena leptocephala]